jgi:hypothetical protein
MTDTIKVAVRLKDGSKRLYTTPHHGFSVDEIRRIIHEDMPAAVVAMIEVPRVQPEKVCA